MEQTCTSQSIKADSCSAGKEIPCVRQTLGFITRAQRSPLLDPVQNQFDPSIHVFSERVRVEATTGIQRSSVRI